MGLLMSHADASISQYSGKHIFSTTHLRNIFVMTFECFILNKMGKVKQTFFKKVSPIDLVYFIRPNLITFFMPESLCEIPILGTWSNYDFFAHLMDPPLPSLISSFFLQRSLKKPRGDEGRGECFCRFSLFHPSVS